MPPVQTLTPMTNSKVILNNEKVHQRTIQSSSNLCFQKKNKNQSKTNFKWGMNKRDIMANWLFWLVIIVPLWLINTASADLYLISLTFGHEVSSRSRISLNIYTYFIPLHFWFKKCWCHYPDCPKRMELRIPKGYFMKQEQLHLLIERL